MEIIILLTFALAATPVGAAFVTDVHTRNRMVRYAKVHWVPKRKSLAPNIIPEGFAKLEPRNKDWGPDGKLTQLWQDAFDYWQMKDPKGAMESYRTKSHELDQNRMSLESTAKAADAIYETYINNRGGRSMTVDDAVKAKGVAREARNTLRQMEREPYYTPEERVAKRLAERYGTEVFYNNDLVRLSSQKKMPTFDYIALTSV